MSDPDTLVELFAQNVVKQTQSIWHGDAKAGNRCADAYVRAWRQLRSMGDEGREALVKLLDHESSDVRSAAATCLLRYCTEKSRKVLQEIVAGEGLIAFEAQQALERWEEGNWHLDPEDEAHSPPVD